MLNKVLPLLFGEGAGGGLGRLALDADALLAHFPGPAALVDGRGRRLAANRESEALLRALAADAVPELAAAIPLAAEEGRAMSERAVLAGPAGAAPVALDVALLPVSGRDKQRLVLLLGRDATVERNLLNALVASRQLYRDLVSCSADFGWETDAQGRFVFVSGTGALGYTPQELNGIAARSLLAEGRPAPKELPFEARARQDEVELWLSRADGHAACLMVSALPVHDADGGWKGARGVCRDVTEVRQRAAEQARTARRERVLGRIVEAMRNELVPERILDQAAEATLAALDAQAAWVFRADPDGYEPVAATGAEAKAAMDMALTALGPCDPPRPGAIEAAGGGLEILAAVATQQGRANGAIAVARRAPFGEDERQLLAAVAPHLGIALQQVAAIVELKRLSLRDALTGLYNRRAFLEQVSARMAAARRMMRPAALLYVDLDNFKQVNDRLGHPAGDAALRAVARLLERANRAADLVARLGGDEFALWLDETDRGGAVAKAEHLLTVAAELAPLSAPGAKPLGFSIGIAMFDPESGEGVEALTTRADAAMYKVKQAGKGTFVVADPAGAPP
ncbi:MAG: diguanylate cyclase [Alphaproteobacteria bacterium]|nr:diguanylate cyclase [Alphaproteobacteria bacterium]